MSDTIDPIASFSLKIGPDRADAMVAFLRQNAGKLVRLPPCFDPSCHPLPSVVDMGEPAAEASK